VARIREQGKGVCQDAANNLNDEKDKIDNQHPPHALIGKAASHMVVMVMVTVFVTFIAIDNLFQLLLLNPYF